MSHAWLVLWGVCWLSTAVLAKDRIWIPLDNVADWQRVRALVDDTRAPRDGGVRAWVDAAGQERLRRAEIPFQVEQADETAFYARRAASNRRAEANFGGFRNLAQIEAELDRLHQLYPAWISAKHAVGHSAEGRAVWAVQMPAKARDNAPVLWLDGLHHAREPMSGEVVLRFAAWLAARAEQDSEIQQVLANRRIMILPCVNPDGYFYNEQIAPNGGGLWRKNRRPLTLGVGVDLNRNYGWRWGETGGGSDLAWRDDFWGEAPFSEAETAAIRDLLAQVSPAISITVHGYGQEWMYPWGWQALAASQSAWLHHLASAWADPEYTVDSAWNLYGISAGAADDYHYGTHGSLAFTLEVGTEEDGFWPAPERIEPLFEQVRPALWQAAQWAGPWIQCAAARGEALSGNGDGQADPGETWRLQVQVWNQGVGPAQGRLRLAETEWTFALGAASAAWSPSFPVTIPDAGAVCELAWEGITRRAALPPLNAETPARLPDAPQIRLAAWRDATESWWVQAQGPASTPFTLYGAGQAQSREEIAGIAGWIRLTQPQALLDAALDAQGEWRLALPPSTLREPFRAQTWNPSAPAVGPLWQWDPE